MGLVSLPHCPQSPLGDCSAKKRVSPECHCVPSPHGALTPCWLSALGMGLAGIPPPKSHPPQGGNRDTCACSFSAGGQGGSFSLSLPSLIQQHKNPSAAACPVPHVPLTLQPKGQGTAPLCVLSAPAVPGLLFVEGCPRHRAAWYPNASRSCRCSAPIRMPRPPQFPL